MKKFWAIFKHEYTRHVLRRRFLMALLSLPLWLAFSIGMAFLAIFLENDPSPVGFVDQAGVIQEHQFSYLEQDIFEQVTFQPFASEAEAQAALDSKKIQSFFVLPADFIQTRSARLIYREQPNARVTNQFNEVLRANLLASRPVNVAERVIEGPQLMIEATEEARKMGDDDWKKIIAPMVAGIFLIIGVFTSSGYLMQAVIEEKENRTMEILATSLSPEQIMGGKTIALICVGLTQILVWSLVPLLLVGLGAAYIPFLQGFDIDWGTIGLVLVTVLPTFVLISALMATIGSTVTEAREGQQVSSLVSLFVMAPAMLATPIMFNPGGPLSLFLSFFPLTASLTMLIRTGFSTVPTWQVLVSTALLIISAVGAIWLSGRVFRLGMLQYGRRLGWKDVAGAIRPTAQSKPAPQR